MPVIDVEIPSSQFANTTINAGPGDVINIPTGMMGSITINGGPDVTVNVLGDPDGGSTFGQLTLGGFGSDIEPTVNIPAGTDFSRYNIDANGENLTLNVGDGATLSDIDATGMSNTGTLTINAGNDVTIDGPINNYGADADFNFGSGATFNGNVTATSVGNADVTIGDDADVNGSFNASSGSNVDVNVTFGDNLQMVAPLNVLSGGGEKNLTIGDGATINNAINMGAGTNTPANLTIGDDVRLLGNINTGNADDVVVIGDNWNLANVNLGLGDDNITLGMQAESSGLTNIDGGFAQGIDMDGITITPRADQLASFERSDWVENGDGTWSSVGPQFNGGPVYAPGLNAYDFEGPAAPLPPTPDGIVDGENSSEVMNRSYDDAAGATNSGGDIIDGADGDNDVILGNGGDDTINAGLGTDEVYGGSGNDVIDGNAGNDTISGDFADGVSDVVVDSGTQAGDDILEGGAGDDVIYGDSGNSLSAGGEGVPGDTLGAGPGSTGGGYDRISAQTVYNGNHSFSTDAFHLGNDIPVLDDANRDAITGVSFSQDGEGTDRSFGLDELEFTGAQRSFVGLVTVQKSGLYNSNDQFSSSISGGFQDTTVVSSGTADFTMNDGEVFQGIRVHYVRGPDGETYMMPDDGPSPAAFNSFRAMLSNNSSGIDSFTIATGSGDDNGINPIEGNWADGQFFETGEGDGGDDTIIGGTGADQMFGEGGDDTFVVGSAAEGAGDVISGGFGPDDTTDNDVLDLTGAGPVTINASADANDAGAQSGTVTFADGSTLTFEGIETIIQDPDNTAPDVTGPAAVDMAEDDTGTIATYATTDPDGDPVALTLTGDDAALFEIDPATGELSPINPLDFENPTDANGDGVYDVTVVATDTGGLTDEQPVAVTVTDVPEPNAIVDGEDTGEVMRVGYDDSNAPTDGGGDLITDEADVIDGNGGDDTISSGGGDDTVDGGADDDLLDGGAGDDEITGGTGTDTLIGGAGADTLDGGGDDDDIMVGAGDTALGGSGDDEFYVNPSLTGDAPITVVGGELDESLNDPTNGGDGDTLDLRGLGEVEIVYNEDDPTFDPATGASESGTATYTNDAGEPVTINFSEIEDVLTDPQADGIVDGAGEGELMNSGYTDPQGDQIDGDDGVDDTILGNGGSDTIDAGLGDDSVEGGEDDDVIGGNDGADTLLGNEGNDDIDGGAGDDTLLGGDEADTLTGGSGDDVLNGEDGDDDIAVGGADTALGGLGDDVFTVDPTDFAPDVDVTIDGGSDGTTGDPAGPENGDEGDVLDLSDQLGDLDVVLEADPESGTVDGLDTDDTPDINFDEIEQIETGLGDDLIDGSDADAPVVADGNEGEDTLLGGAGNDTLDGGDDDDLLDGDDGDDVLLGNDGNDTLDGGEGADTLEGGLNDDDITLGAGDTGLGGGGDDEFTIDPTVAGTAPITVVGGEADEEGVIDPTNNPDGQVGDTLDLTGLGPVEIAYDETDPTFDPETGIGESGTVTYPNADGLPVVIEFSEIENILTDGPVDVTPVANPDAADTDEDTTVVIDVLANDTDPDNTPEELEVTEATAPNGTVEINDDGTLSYTPDPEYSGSDEITYTVSDPEGNTAVGTVTLDVAPVNDAPVANDDAATTDEETPVTIDVLANDEDEDNTPDDLTVTGATAPNGTVVINDDRTLEYTPDAGFVGEDTITYVVSDPSGATDTATVAVTVEAIPDEAPVANPDTATVEEGEVVTIDVLANDTDPDTPLEELEVTDADAPNGIVDINDDGTLSYEPDAGFFGEDTITYTVTDPEGNSATSTVTVSVTEEPVGDAPVAQADVYDIDLDGYEGGNVRLGSGDDGLLGNDTDPNDDPLRVSEIDGSSNLRTWVDGDNGGQIRITSSGAVRFRDDEGDFADLPDGEVVQTTVSYTVSDGNGGFDTATVTVNVTGAAVVDDLSPDAVDDVASATAGDVTVIDVLANDTDPDTPVDQLEVIDAEAENGIIDINDDGTLSYEPDAGFSGEDTITYTITDPEGNTDTAIVTVTVSEGDVTPVANPDSADVDEDTTVVIDVLANDTDPDNTPEELEVTEATAPNGTVEINDDGTLSYTPDSEYSGSDEITYTVSDPEGNTAVGTVTIAVDPVNDAPVATDDTAETDEDTSVTIDVLANDSDADNTPEELAVTEATAPNGTVVINDDGTLEYTPDDGFFGVDEITYTVSDPDGASSTATVAVTVDEVIDGGDGVVDGTDGGEVMDPGFDDGEGDQVDGADGIDDVIEGNGGNDTIDGGLGNDDIDGGDGDDVIQGGDGNDTIEGSQGNDDILGGDGDDTYQGDDQGHVVVYVDDEGNGEVTKYPTQEIDSVNSVEHFSGAEVEGELDKISFTTAVGSNSIEEDIEGLDDNATGYFFPVEGDFVNFGPDNDYTLSDLFSGTSPDGELPAVGPAGEYFVSDGTEEGQVGEISFENFEQIFFTIEEEPEVEEDIMALLSNGETLDETMPTEEEVDEDDLAFDAI